MRINIYNGGEQKGNGNKGTNRIYQADDAPLKKGHKLISSAIIFLQCAQLALT